MKKATFLFALAALIACMALLVACHRSPTGETGDTPQGVTGDSGDTTAGATDVEAVPGESDPAGIDPNRPPYEGDYPSDRGFLANTILTSDAFPSLEGLTAGELATFFQTGEMEGRGDLTKVFPAAGGCIVDYGLYYIQPDYRYYDQVTGKTGPLCPEADCDTATCPLARAYRFLYAGDEHLYFTAPDLEEAHRGYARVYRCDLSRQNIEELMRTDIVIDAPEPAETNAAGEEIDDGSASYGYYSGFERIYHADGDRIYMTKLHYEEGEKPTTDMKTYGIFDCSAKVFTPIEAAAGKYVQAVIDGDTVFCREEYEEGFYHYYKANLDFTEVQPLSELDALLDGQFAYVSGFTDGYLLVEKYNSGTHRYDHDVLYDPNTGRVIDWAENLSFCKKFVLTDQYIYYTRDLWEDEIETSPLKDYFEYTFISQANGRPKVYDCLNREAGRVYRMNLDTLEEELVLELAFNDVPVWIQDIRMNGGQCFVTYSTYKEFRNLYNKGHEASTSHSRQHFAIVDFGSGTVRLIEKN